jgi:hypothetical protein
MASRPRVGPPLAEIKGKREVREYGHEHPAEFASTDGRAANFAGRDPVELNLAGMDLQWAASPSPSRIGDLPPP